MRSMNDAIRHLDARFRALRPLATSPRPAHGWLRAVRNALGMTTTQAAARVGVVQSAYTAIERGEVEGAVTLRTLRRAAEALDCRLVYALVPNKPLSETVEDRARCVALESIAVSEHTMRLEGQGVASKSAHKELLRKATEELLRHPSRLWRDEK